MNDFTPRQTQILEAIRWAAIRGNHIDIASLARNLGIRPGTVRSHLRLVYTKIRVRDRAGLVAYLLRERWGIEE